MVKRGPRTTEGKEVAKFNAVKHGLRSDAPVVSELESWEDWEEFREGIVAAYAVEGRLETELAETCASLLWRKRRCVRWETAAIDRSIDGIPDDLDIAATFGEKLGIPRDQTITPEKVHRAAVRRLLPSKDDMETVMRSEGHLHRLWIQTHHELEAIQARRKGDRVSSLTRIDVAGSPP
jgi:hypothetical protein